MIKIIYKIIISFVIVFLVLTTYLSTIGIKTDKLNQQISSHLKGIDKNLEVQLKDVSIFLDPFNFKLDLKTIGTNLKYKNKTIELESVKSNISIKSLLNNKFSLNKVDISTKSIKIKDLISF